EPEAEVVEAPPARARRRAVRKATAPAGAPQAAEAVEVVEPVASAEAAEPEAEVVEPEAEVVEAPPARARRRAVRKATAPAGA
ncbi:hypothetical protein, partial [Streptomyces sp. BE133]|uniref:hypothetical protein n=1 Tax=Streptomyces sp. BE133 TaxID=3002523 RepID=UPI002E75F1B2